MEQPSSADLVERAYLLRASSEAVYSHLLGRRPKQRWDPQVAPETLRLLLARRDFIIQLAIAQVTVDPEILATVYRDGNLELRCAVLANPMLGEAFYLGDATFFESNEELASFLSEAPTELLEAYLTNQSIRPKVLVDILRRSDESEDERWQLLLRFAIRNPMLRVPVPRFVDPQRDFFRDAEQASACAAAWGLLESLPPDDGWAGFLVDQLGEITYELPCHVPVDACSGSVEACSEEEDAIWEQIDAFSAETRRVETVYFRDCLTRWTTPQGSEPRPYWADSLGRLRLLVAKRAVNQIGGDFATELRESEDAFSRSGYYAAFRPTDIDEVRNLCKADGTAFLAGAVQNSHLVGNPGRRKYLWILKDEIHSLADHTESRSLAMKLRFFESRLRSQAPDLVDDDNPILDDEQYESMRSSGDVGGLIDLLSDRIARAVLLPSDADERLRDRLRDEITLLREGVARELETRIASTVPRIEQRIASEGQDAQMRSLFFALLLGLILWRVW